ncbi:MAG TPA: lanthionine synthetase LanC family protein [Candidatus Acidoferrales bacterium]|nr:lanthionine synthetase LanC family protein [Candidatus Acidoferrales bacterium]
MTDVSAIASNLVEPALEWLVASSRERERGSLAWPAQRSDAEVDASLYMGTAGVVTTLIEAHRTFGDDRYADLALRGARWLSEHLNSEELGLYLGLTGTAYALSAAERALGDAESGVASRKALDIVRSRFDGERWNVYTELLYGHAGIALGALAAGDIDLAMLAADGLVSLAEPTDAGVQWTVWQGLGHRLHNMAHGTVGIAYALAAVGAATDRADFLATALAGTRDVLSLAEDDGGDGFLVHHSDPQLDGSERYSFGWCHGPAGDAQLFRLLGQLQPDQGWDDLVQRCWRTVVRSGIPNRKRPGFWDNNGHCCGTAGVLAVALDLQADGTGDLGFASTLLADLHARAIIDADGARWSNVEYRDERPDLEPQTGWAHGNAGIIRELLRATASGTGAPPSFAVAWPDQPPTR